jgi:hypothetical protein
MSLSPKPLSGDACEPEPVGGILEDEAACGPQEGHTMNNKPHLHFFLDGIFRAPALIWFGVLLASVVSLVLSLSPAEVQATSLLTSRVYLPMVIGPDLNIPVSSVLTPFDADLNDLGGPSSWSTNYGKTPEIIVASNGIELDVLAQDYNSETAWKAVLLHIRPGLTGYKITQALTNIPMLDRMMGLASDASGNRYYATCVDESALVSPTYPPLNTYRSNIVRVIKLNPAGDVQFNIDLDTARYAYNNYAEMIINPMVASTERLCMASTLLQTGISAAHVIRKRFPPGWMLPLALSPAPPPFG